MQLPIEVYSQSVFDWINRDAAFLHPIGDCRFTEGPVWHPDGYYLFSDIPANTVYRWKEGEEKSLFLKPSGTDRPDDPLINREQPGSNGLALDRAGNLILCRHGGHDVAVWNGRDLQPLISQFEGRPFNSPNDLILHSGGRIYFSDPPYGLRDGKLNAAVFQPSARVYCWKDGELQSISDKYSYPNGVCLSPDEDVLFICSNKANENFIAQYSTKTHEFMGVFAEETSDGIECDPHGNIYLCNKNGIIVLGRDGQRLARIVLPSVPANCCWGGYGGKDLFITARENIFLIRSFLK